MHTKNILQQLAIQAAKDQDWGAAITHNQEMLSLFPDDINALNRLGMAQLQMKHKKEAKECFERVLELDRSNILAKKHLHKLKHNQTIPVPTFSDTTFIEEPGKTKTVDLHRLASKDSLDQLTIGITCQLKPRNRYISIEVDSKYVGALPEDLSFRLTKLIHTGNEYSCHILSVNATNCSVFLRETNRSQRNEFVNSFPVQKTTVSGGSELSEGFLNEEEIPVQIVDTDTDEERMPESFEPEEN